MTARRRRVLVAGGAVLVAAIVVTGCGRGPAGVAAVDDRGGALASGPTTQPTEPAPPAPSAAAPSVTGDSSPIVLAPAPAPTPAAPPVVSASQPPATAPPTPPDLSAIDQLLDELDAALGADAAAELDEGSAP